MNSFDQWLRRAIKSALMSFYTADLSAADLREADLRGANLRGANLRGANLRGADLREADLRGANFANANSSGADLSGVDLRWANLSEVNLRGANLANANISGAHLSGTDLSGANGLLSAREWLSQHFTFDESGVIVFKAIGNTSYCAPSAWDIKPGAVLMEVCNPDRTTDCGCGVNFGTEQWVRANYEDARIWRCRIEWLDLAGTVVPYHTDGKARCERLVLLEDVTSCG